MTIATPGAHDWDRVRSIAEGLWQSIAAAYQRYGPIAEVKVPFTQLASVDTRVPMADDDVVLARACQILARKRPEVVVRCVRDGVIVGWRQQWDMFRAIDREIIRRSGGEVVPLADHDGFFGLQTEVADGVYVIRDAEVPAETLASHLQEAQAATPPALLPEASAQPEEQGAAGDSAPIDDGTT